MRFLISLLVCICARAADMPYFHVLSEDAGAWPAIFASIGLEAHPEAGARIFVARGGTAAAGEWRTRVEKGAVLVLEGESSLAAQFGFASTHARSVRVASISDVHRPALAIIWEHALDLPVYDVPPDAQIFGRERWTGAPVAAGKRIGAGAVLWIAASPGERGHERFPYLLQALRSLGVESPFRDSRLWAFFDSSYRSRVDLDYMAARWRKAGIAALHVAAWHYYEPAAESDDYLEKLIEACHREGILVYAWLELPHVSQKFWADHPEWRERTAAGQDAHLDWRKLMNLVNRDCFAAVSAGVRELVQRFDWDGINLAELYFESLEGIDNASRFTPMNDDVRQVFRERDGFDPLELFSTRNDPVSRKRFLDFRAELARRMQEEWLEQLQAIRRSKPDLDLVLTHVDDRYDTGIRDAIGADAAAVLPLLDSQNFTFLIEDPATVWDLGPDRYRGIAERYVPLTPHRDKLAIDVNIVERYQDVYPTRQQTGIELFQLVHLAAQSFSRVALYFEQSILAPDLELLPAAAASVSRYEIVGSKLVVDSARGAGIRWQGGAIVDGLPWPVRDDETLWLTAGPHTIEPGNGDQLRLVRFNGTIRRARAIGSNRIEFEYESPGRAIAMLDRPAASIEVDGEGFTGNRAAPNTILLPRGRHFVTIASE